MGDIININNLKHLIKEVTDEKTNRLLKDLNTLWELIIALREENRLLSAKIDKIKIELGEELENLRLMLNCKEVKEDGNQGNQ